MIWCLAVIFLIIISLIGYTACILAGEADDRAERWYKEEISKRSWNEKRMG